MSSLHPIETTEKLRRAYERYLKTIYPFQDKSLRESFWQELSNPPERLVKGPLLEASPPFKTGRSIEALVADGILHRSFLALCDSTTHLPRSRPLYVHQEKAVLNVVRQERNLIMATGTGSGKTESFLIPILNYLLREGAAGTLPQPGVRALLLYPMNALANDQLKRLRELLRNYPAITFGRYTGETEHEFAKARAQYREEFGTDPISNEMISRDVMRARPPHILLTNYAMLEYLLLRPQDTELFDGPTGRHWRFIVLDEAHVYDGASGIEVAMLLRRLKDRLVQSERGRLTCIATSATLGKGREDFGKTAAFASELFGEEFTEEVVFEAERPPLSALGNTWGAGTLELYRALATLFESNRPNKSDATVIKDIARHHAVPTEITQQIRDNQEAAEALYRVLQGDSRLHHLQSILHTEGPTLLNNVAERLFPELESSAAQEATVHLVSSAVRARPDEDSMPLLPARYHVFARALEGAFACLNIQGHADSKPHLYLRRHERCPDCGAEVFELATCARCGIAYLVAQKQPISINDRPYDALTMPKGGLASERRALAYYVLADHLPEPNEDESPGEASVERDEWPPHTLCVQCGVIVPQGDPLPCSCHVPEVSLRAASFDGTEQEKMHCPHCATRSSGVVYRLLTGQDAPVSVLATALYAELPAAERESVRELPGQGRKLLMFADSRQDAAFFAPYLERTYMSILRRRLIYQTLHGDEAAQQGQLRLEDLAGRLQQRAEQAGIFSLRDSIDTRRREMRKWLMHEMVATDRNQSLEGLGLLQLRLVWPPGWQPPSPLLEPPWNLTPSEAEVLLRLLLDTLRHNGVLLFPDGVAPDDEIFRPRNRRNYVSDLSAGGRGYTVVGWRPRRGSNNRLDLLIKLLAKCAPHISEPEGRRLADETLHQLWEEHLAAIGNVWRNYEYLRVEHLGQSGPAYRLDYALWEWVPPAATTLLWQCNRCRTPGYYTLRGLCPVYGCDGQLEPIQANNLAGAHNHYRYMYRHLHPAAIRVEEHTAQWKATEGRRIQNEFIEGKVNALSCSTTFELGVDVGELQAVLMRNVPPTTANYVQRAGRAGRRKDVPAFALTFAQRRSHDLAHYRRPEQLVSGKIPTPAITIRNKKIVERHVYSVLIAAFLRWCDAEFDRFNERRELKVGPFFAPEGNMLMGPELLQQFLVLRPEPVRQALLRIVPPDLHSELKVADWGWLPEFTSKAGEGVFDQAAAKILESINVYKTLINEAAGERRFGQAEFYQKVLNTIRGRDLLNFWGQHGVLPKYGFPVDVVDFITDYVPDQAASRVELQRDLRIALSEFAPGSKLIAAKKVWTGGGVYKPPDKNWQPIAFAICPECNHFIKRDGDQFISQCDCGRSLPLSSGGIMIKPEFGFLAKREEKLPEPGESRPPRIYASRVYFRDYIRPDNFLQGDHQETAIIRPELSGQQIQIATKYSRYGEMVLVNRGPNGLGFHICLNCGFAQPFPKVAEGGHRRNRERQRAQHSNPRNGHLCAGNNMVQYHLGHDFITDVMEIQMLGAMAQMDTSLDSDKSTWHSVLYALLEGASAALGISRDDLNGTLYHQPHLIAPALILYDDVPGGAGHVKRVNESLHEVFKAALGRVADCDGCSEETACHGCLWNFRNQPFHDKMSRGLAINFLRQVLVG